VYIQNTGAYSFKLYTQHCEVTQSFNIIGPSVINIKDTISTCTQSSVTPPTYSHTSNIWMNKNGDVINDTYTFQNDSYIYTTYTTIEGCTIKDSMLVLVIPKPIIITPDTLLCKGSTISYTPDLLTTLPSTARFEWLYNGQLIGNQSQLIIQQAGPYTVEVINENCSVKNNFIVNEIPLPISLLESEKKICFTESVGLKLFAGTHATYNWQNGSSNEAYFTIQQPGTYFITITNIEGCSAKDSIKIVEACPPKLFVAEAYTPNGDGLNDVFKVNHEYITQFKMVVYNRWGEIIFISEDPNESWNGEYKNEQMPMGVYPYIITYESMFEEYKGPYKKTGSVTLIR
jgi:gliding motility-associated-like protein